DVRADHPFPGLPPRLFGGGGEPLLPEKIDRLRQIALRLREGGFTIHDSGSGLLPKLLNGVNSRHDSSLSQSLCAGPTRRRAQKVSPMPHARTLTAGRAGCSPAADIFLLRVPKGVPLGFIDEAPLADGR